MTSEPLSDEGGSVLIMVLVFIVAFGLITGAILQFADTGFETIGNTAIVRDKQHAVDGAVEGAINSLRGQAAAGKPGSVCGPFTPPAAGSDPTVTVTCTPETPDSGSATDQPNRAVLTLGQAAGEGFFQDDNGSGNNDELTIDGGIFSHGVINVSGSNSKMTVFGDVGARGACSSTISATGSKTCNIGAGWNPGTPPTDPYLAADPGYPYAMATIPTTAASVDPTPSCGSSSNNTNVVKFTPGYYSENPYYLVPPNCDGTVWWFSTGVYYFDLPSGPAAVWDLHGLPPSCPSSAACKTGISVVGGTLLNGWNETTNDNTVETALKNGRACDRTQPGVQFIVGGETRLTTQTGSEFVELCGSALDATTTQQIALFSLTKSVTNTKDSANTVLNRSEPSPNPDREGALGSFAAYSSPSNATHIDGTSASANFVFGGLTAANLTLQGFPAVPLGSTVTQVKLKVAHHESGANPSQISTSATLNWGPAGTPCTPPGATCKTYPLSGHAGSAPVTDTIDITGDLRSILRYRDVNALTAMFAADGSALTCVKNGGGGGTCNASNGTFQSATTNLDGIAFEVHYLAPAFEAQRCPVSSPSCFLLLTNTNPTMRFLGTVYAPGAALDLGLHNNGDTIFGRGVIARTINAHISASSKQSDAPFQLPNANARRQVLFTAYVGGVAKLRARVLYTDVKPDPAPATTFTGFPGYKVSILDWVVYR